MKDERKTKAKLVEELSELRKRVRDLEALKEELMLAETALRGERAKFESMVTSLGDGLDIVGTDYRIHFQNEMLQKRFGDVIGELCYRVYVGREIPCEDCPMVAAIATGSTKRAETTGVDGREYEVTSTPFEDSDGVTRVIEVVRDITERKHAEKALQQERDNLLRIFTAMEDGVYIVDQQYDIQYVNPVLTNEFGPWEERKCYEYFHDRSEVCPWCKNERVFAGETVRWEWFSSRNDRTYDLMDTPLRSPDGSIHKLEIFRDITERKRIEDALQESEERYRAIFEQAADSIVLHDPETAAILDFNDKAHESLGYTREEFAKLSVLDIHVAESVQSIRAHSEKIAKKGIETFETKHKSKSGEMRDVQVNIRAVTIRGKRLLQAVSRDVTEMKEAERALTVSEERYRSLFESTGTAMVIIEEDMMLSLANAGFENLSGYRKEEIEGKVKWPRYVVPDDLAKMLVYHTERRREGADPPREFEFGFITRDGAVRDLLIFVDLIPGTKRSVASLLDITERKRGEEAQRESRERYIALFEQAAESIVVVDAESGALVEFNDRAYEALGYTREEFGKLRISNIEVTESVEEVAEHLRRIVDTGFDVFETRQRAKSGEIRDIQVSSKAVTIGGGNYVQSIWRDITDSKRAELQLEASRQQMRALSARIIAAQEEERTRISREIHDELAQALTTLTFDLAWLGNKLPEEDVAVQNKVMTMNQRIGETIKAVQRISAELRPGMLDDLGLVAAVEWYLTDFQERTGITCDLKMEPEDFTLDTGRCTTVFRIFQEALTNVARHASATNVKVKLQKRKGRLLLEVRDDGRGITAEQAASSRSLGLTGMRERARLWNGSVTIKGTEGKGTAVLVEIPLDEPSTDRDAK